MLNIMKEPSVPFDDAVSCYDYTASVAYEDEYEAMADNSSSAREKPVPMPLRPPLFSHTLT
jgi:hypothetical protein